MKGNNLKIIKKILKDKGEVFLMKKLGEEAQELSLAIIHLGTKKDTKKRLHDIHCEFADLKIQMRLAEEYLNKRKINRLVNKKLKEKNKKFRENDNQRQNPKAV